MKKHDHDAIRTELDRLKSNGVIRPVDVVDAAREESSPLHGWFNWDDSEAAHQYRLLQARNLLRVYVIVDTPESNPVRALVSLTTDRNTPGGGYRAIADVMGDQELRDQLLRDAFVQLGNLRKKYQHLQELAAVWAALDEAAPDQANAA